MNRSSKKGKGYRVIATLVLATVMAVMVPSCRHTSRCCHGDDARYAQMDSLLRDVRDVDSLAAMVQRYQNEGDLMGEMVALRYKGRALCDQSRFDEAIAAHTRGLKLATEVADTIEMISALNGIANDYRYWGDLSKANGFFYKALQLSKAYSGSNSPEALKARVVTLNGIGIIEIGLHRYTSADSLLREALKGEKSLGNDQGMAVNFAHLGAIKRAQGDRDSAWMYYRESMKLNQMEGNGVGVALCHLHFGELYADENDYSRAQVEFQQAYDQLKEQGPAFFWLRACLSLAGVNILLGEKETALQYAQEAESEAKRINSREFQAHSYHVLYELSLMSGDQHRALEYFVKSEELYDSIYGLEKSEEMRHQLNEYESNVKLGEMSSLNNDIKRLNRTRNLMGLFTILLILMAGAIIAALVYASRVRSRTQRLMKQVEETRSLFFTNVVHQLRTPLTAIMGATDAIVAQTDVSGNTSAEHQRENVEIIERQGNHLLLLVDRILEVGGVRSDLKGPDWRTGDVVGFLRMIVESYREQCLDQQIELTYVSNENEVTMDIVPNYLNTIVGNLIENAISYSSDYCKISVMSQVVGNKLVIKVVDNGMGIEDNDLPHVFEPFYRAAVAEQICEGIGIGLTVVRDMASVLDGTVTVESVSGSGSVFTVLMPLRNRHNEVYEKLEMAVKPVRKIVRKRLDVPVDDSSDSVKKARADILVIEDHNDVARLVGAALETEFNVHYASNGEQGLESAARLMPDLIITDVKMPYVDGLELCRRVRASRRLRHIPIIVLSARTSEQDRIRGFEAGADAYMLKPFSADELKVLSSKLLENREILKEVYSDTARKTDAQVVESLSQMDDEELLVAFAELLDKQVENGTARLNLGEIAVQLKMGETQLRNSIQNLTGKTTAAYITQLRMEKAMRLLQENPTMLIGTVAEQCGFSDVAYFSRVFKQHFKMTPTRARVNDPD